MADYEKNGADVKLDGIDTVEAVLNAMTDEERVNMLVNAAALGEKYIKYGAAGTTFSIDRLGVPLTSLLDGPVGIARYGTVTAFPSLPIMAATWDKELIYKVGCALGYETVELGFDCILGPGMNIQRNPLGGRNADYFSEDPVLSGLIASAYINGVQAEGALADVKHFIANVAETIRERNDSVMSERALREVYLRNFELAVKRSNPGTIMTTYNLVNNKFVTQNPEILKNIVRDEWKYEGVIVTDWFAGAGIRPEEFDYDSAKMIAAGSDILYPGSPAAGSPIDRRAELMEWMNASNENYQRASEAIRTILTYIQRTPTYKHALGSGTIPPDRLELNSALSRMAAAEGSVLLKNEGALPLEDGACVALFGDAKYNTLFTGGGSAEIGGANRYKSITIKEGLENVGLALNQDIEALYGASTSDVEITEQAAVSAAEKSNVAVYAVRKFSAEWADRKPDTGELGYYLPTQTVENMKRISAAFSKKGKKLVVVINSTGPIDTEQWGMYADAIVYIGAGGNETGNALADILTGKVNPSGKLAQTFPKNYNDVPGSAEFPGQFKEKGFPENPENNYRTTHHDEGIYVGYKYFDTFGKEVSFPFGFGLSYTDFVIGDIRINGIAAKDTYAAPISYAPSADDEGIVKITATVTNIGKTAGKEVVQAYVHMKGCALETPLYELKAFAKTDLLQPGQSQIVTLEIDKELLKYYDDKSAAWVIPMGGYEIRIGNSSNNVSDIVCINVPSDILILQSDHYGVLAKDELARQLTEIKKKTDGGIYQLVSRTDKWDNTDDGYVRTVKIDDAASLQKLIIKGLQNAETLLVNGKEYKATANTEIPAVDIDAKDILTITVKSGDNVNIEVLGQFAKDADRTDISSAISQAEEKLRAEQSGKVHYEISSMQALEKALISAKEQCAKSLLTQKEADNARDALVQQIEALKVARAQRCAYEPILGNTFDDKSDIIRVDEGGEGSPSMGYAQSGQWLLLSQVNFTGAGAEKVTIRYGMPSGTVNPTITLVLDDKDNGQKIAVCRLTRVSGAWQSMETESFELTGSVRGLHDVYVLFSEGTGLAPCNFDQLCFEKAAAGDTKALAPLCDKVKKLMTEKYADAADNMKRYLLRLVKEAGRAITQGDRTGKEVAHILSELTMAASDKFPLYFAYKNVASLDMAGFEKDGADKVISLMKLAEKALKTDEATQTLAEDLAQATSALAAIPGYAFNPIEAQCGQALGEPFVNDNGRIRAINGQAVVAYHLTFGEKSATQIKFDYCNPSGVMAHVKLMIDKPTAAPIAALSLPKTEDDEVTVTADLEAPISGHHIVYLTLTNTQDIAYGISHFNFI